MNNQIVVCGGSNAYAGRTDAIARGIEQPAPVAESIAPIAKAAPARPSFLARIMARLRAFFSKVRKGIFILAIFFAEEE